MNHFKYCREIMRQVTSLSLLMSCSVIFYLSSCRGLILFSLNSLLHWQRFCRIKYSNYCIECEQLTAHCTFLNHKAEYVGKISEAVSTTKSMDSVFCLILKFLYRILPLIEYLVLTSLSWDLFAITTVYWIWIYLFYKRETLWLTISGSPFILESDNHYHLFFSLDKNMLISSSHEQCYA